MNHVLDTVEVYINFITLSVTDSLSLALFIPLTLSLSASVSLSLSLSCSLSLSLSPSPSLPLSRSLSLSLSLSLSISLSLSNRLSLFHILCFHLLKEIALCCWNCMDIMFSVDNRMPGRICDGVWLMCWYVIVYCVYDTVFVTLNFTGMHL